MIGRAGYIIEKVVLYTRRFGLFGPLLMFRLYWLYFRRRAEPVFVRLGKDRDGIWIRPASDLGIFHQVFIHDEYGFEIDGEVATIVDAGANIGCASIYFARRFPAARIVAIEPMPSTFEMLERNIVNRPNISARNAALWSENEQIELVDEWQNHLAVRVQRCSDSSGRVLVNGLTMWDIAELFPSGVIDILKIDIEGAEDEVFAAAPEWLEKVGHIIIEFHDGIRPGSQKRILDAIQRNWRSIRLVVRGENVLIFRAEKEGGLASAVGGSD